MPGMEAGIQFRRDASGNVHVNLDSNTPCWNDAIGERLELIQALPTLFSKKGFPLVLNFALCASFVVKYLFQSWLRCVVLG